MRNGAISRTLAPSSRRDRPAWTQGRLQTLYAIAAATLAAIIPLVVFAGFWMRSELNKNQHETEAFLTAQARALSYRIDGEIREQLSALTALAALPSADAPNVQEFTEDVDRIMMVMPTWSVVGLVDAETRQHLVSRGGTWQVDREQEAIETVRRTRRPTVETQPGGIAGREDVLLYVPVLRDQAIRLLVVAAVRVPELQEIAAHPRRDGLLLSILDGKNRVIGRSRAADRFVGQEVSEDFKRAATGSEGLYEGTTLEDELTFGAYARSPLTGWVSFVSMSRAELDAAARRSVWATIAAVALSVVLVAVLGIFLFHTVMERRVSNERLAASQALGELDARLLATTQEALDEQRKAASEREVLLREIYHRVKNNLQIVQSLLRLGSRDLKPDQREPFESAVRRIGAMARVHTLLYNSPDLASIDFKEYLEELMRELSEGFAAEERSIEHALKANSLRLPLDTAVPLAFIAVEILTNAFRHAFPEGRAGMIDVSTWREGNVGTLRIEDNGIGLTPGQRTKRQLGLTIVGKLVQQIGGTLQEPAPGSSIFIITFPLDDEEDAGPSEEQSERFAAAPAS
jgi:two-component sensor histidine kinase